MSDRHWIPGLKNSANRILRKLVDWVETLYGTLITDRKWFAVASAALTDFWSKRMYYNTTNFTYNAFLGMLALLVALSAFIGVISNTSLRNSIISTLKNLTPVFGGGSPERILNKVAAYKTSVGLISLIALLWTGSKIFTAIEWGFGIILGEKGRSYPRKKLVGFLFVSIGSVLVLAAFAVSFGLTSL